MRSLKYYWQLFWVLTQKEFKVRYKASILGYLWSVFNPLAQGCIFFLAFGIFMRFPQENYLLFLLSALYPWQWINNSLSHAPKIFLSCPSLVKKIYFPRFFMPAACAFQDMIHFVFSLPIFFLFCLLYGFAPTPLSFVFIILLLLINYILVASLSIIFSCINIYIRDLENILPMIMQMCFFLTPIIYPLEVIPPAFRPLLYLNPFFSLIVAWRSVLFYNTLTWELVFPATVITIFAVFGARWVYNKLSWKLAELL